MPASIGRKVSLSDALVLLAVPAVWLATRRHLALRQMGMRFWYLDNYYLVPPLIDDVGLFLTILAFVLILLRLRPPRPRRRRLWRQPGLAACAAVMFGVTVKAISTAVSSYANLPAWENDFRVNVLWGPWPYTGPAVAGAWLALLVTGLWRAERSLVDRLGRIVGVCWLLEFMLAEIDGIQWIVILSHLFAGAEP